MAIARFDHAAMPVENMDAMIEFYKNLGFTILGEERFRAGQTPLIAAAFGDNKINMHAPKLWQNPAFTLRGPAAKPGCGDYCFVWEGDLAGLTAHLAAAGATVEVGPVPREGGKAVGTATGTSLYTRDPDGNLLEFIIY